MNKENLMYICSFATQEGPRLGLVENGIVYETQGDVFKRSLEPVSEVGSIEDIDLLPPVRPSKIVCVGRNYVAHAEEFGREVPTEPGLFFKPPSSLIGHGQQILLLPENGRVDHEAELAVVIGRQGHFIAEEDAAQYVLGYTCANDVSDRDFQQSDMQWVRGKGYDTFCPLGPWIVTDLEVADLTIQCRVNGEVKQDSNTSLMIFGVPKIISYVSRIMTLMPGDVILTGTPAGVSSIKKDDVIEVTVEGIGTLTNTVDHASG
jgi:2-keto-4-pentenoate hydratase/2-oxohepta-3-ene-1,7-dioic acid hydratase in catechol pathway